MSEELKQTFLAPRFTVERTEVVPATELEIAAAVVILKARAKHYGVPQHVTAYPFDPERGWRMAGLDFIRRNREEAAKGNGILI